MLIPVPECCSMIETSGNVMEALSSSNYKTVVPAYIETALKIKYAHLIRGTMVLNFAYVYGYTIGNPAGVFYTCLSMDSKVASTIKSKKKVL